MKLSEEQYNTLNNVFTDLENNRIEEIYKREKELRFNRRVAVASLIVCILTLIVAIVTLIVTII